MTFIPSYFFPPGFPYPLNIGNLGPLTINPSNGGVMFSVSATRDWCRCNCDIGGIGHDDRMSPLPNLSLSSYLILFFFLLAVMQEKKGDAGMSNWQKGTIAICIVGGVIIIVAIIFIAKLRRSKPYVALSPLLSPLLSPSPSL